MAVKGRVVEALHIMVEQKDLGLWSQVLLPEAHCNDLRVKRYLGRLEPRGTTKPYHATALIPGQLGVRSEAASGQGGRGKGSGEKDFYKGV